MCWERLQEKSKAAFLCRQDVLAGQWSEEAPGNRDLCLQRQTLSSTVSFLLDWHVSVFGWCQEKVQGRCWASVTTMKTVTICALWYTDHIWQQREVFRSPFPSFNGTLAAAKRTESWASSHVWMFCRNNIWCTDPAFSPDMRGKRNLGRDETAGRKEKACIYFASWSFKQPTKLKLRFLYHVDFLKSSFQTWLAEWILFLWYRPSISHEYYNMSKSKKLQSQVLASRRLQRRAMMGFVSLEAIMGCQCTRVKPHLKPKHFTQLLPEQGSDPSDSRRLP